MASGFEIKARWAYSEITSSRFGRYYRQHPLDGVDAMADAGLDFDELRPHHRVLLANAVDRFRGPISRGIDQHDAYMLVSWSKGQLCRVETLPLFDRRRGSRLPYFDFLNQDPHTNQSGQVDPIDPRAEAKKVPPGTAVPPPWGGIVLEDSPGLLIDGYLRSILFMRDADRDARLPMWVGLGTAGWRARINLG